jgi:hypothetical protein
MEHFIVQKASDTGIYKKYNFHHLDGCGYIVLEKYNDTWNLELMQVSPTGKGLGTLFLTKVLSLENLSPTVMTVCPTSEDNRRFFRRNGFNI